MSAQRKVLITCYSAANAKLRHSSTAPEDLAGLRGLLLRGGRGRKKKGSRWEGG